MAVEVYQLQLIIQLLPAEDGSNSLKSAIFPTVQNNSLIIGYYISTQLVWVGWEVMKNMWS